MNEGSMQRIKELDERLNHIDREASLLAASKKQTLSQVIDIIDEEYAAEISGCEAVFAWGMDIRESPENPNSKKLRIHVSEHTFEGPMTYTEWSEKIRNLREEIRDILRPVLDATSIDPYIRVDIQNLELVEETEDGEEE